MLHPYIKPHDGSKTLNNYNMWSLGPRSWHLKGSSALSF